MSNLMGYRSTAAIFIALFTVFRPAFAGTDAAAFLNTGVGARALSMGSAFVSVCDDSSAMYWNPAGLARINKFSITTMGQSLGSTSWDTLPDITPKYQFMGITIPVNSPKSWLDKSTFGVGMINSGLDNVTYSYLDTTGKIVRDSFQDTENGYLFSWGLPVITAGNSIYAGVTLKYITEDFSKIAGASAKGYDADFGLLYTAGASSIGLLIERGASVAWSNGRVDSAGLMTKLGVSNNFGLSRYLSLLGSFDVVQRKDEPMMANLGGELGYEKKIGNKNSILFEGIFLRAGLQGYAMEDRNNSASDLNSNINYTAGVGLDMSFWGYYLQFDYGMGSYSLGNQNRISVSLYF